MTDDYTKGIWLGRTLAYAAVLDYLEHNDAATVEAWLEQQQARGENMLNLIKDDDFYGTGESIDMPETVVFDWDVWPWNSYANGADKRCEWLDAEKNHCHLIAGHVTVHYA